MPGETFNQLQKGKILKSSPKLFNGLNDECSLVKFRWSHSAFQQNRFLMNDKHLVHVEILSI